MPLHSTAAHDFLLSGVYAGVVVFGLACVTFVTSVAFGFMNVQTLGGATQQSRRATRKLQYVCTLVHLHEFPNSRKSCLAKPKTAKFVFNTNKQSDINIFAAVDSPRTTRPQLG